MTKRLAGVAMATMLSSWLGNVLGLAPDADEMNVKGSPQRTSSESSLDRSSLRASLHGIHRAGVPGLYAEVRAGDQSWRAGAGFADLTSKRPVRPDMLQRVGSITKTFTAIAVMQQVEKHAIRLDAPIGDYLPHMVPSQRGRTITVRMLLNHTSGLADYLPSAFPSLAGLPDLTDISPESLAENQFKHFRPQELIKMGLSAPATGAPGDTPGVYSNTNYLLLGQLLEKTTGQKAEAYITEHVIDRAGLTNTRFPTHARIRGPHSRMYEELYGLLDPPRDFSVYDMSWVWMAADLISTMPDLNHFYAGLLKGELVTEESLRQMQRTVPVIAQDGQEIRYGLGLHQVDIPGCGTFWGHDGTVFGAQTVSLTRADGKRQMSIALNLVRWNRLDGSGQPMTHPIDAALRTFTHRALC